MKEVIDIKNMTDTNDLVIIKGGLPYLVENIDDMFDLYAEVVEDAQMNEANFKEAVLQAMIKNDLYQFKTNNRTISVVTPKNTIIFDEATFLEEASDEVKDACVEVETKTHFDLERFIKENEELYEKYLVTEKTEKVNLEKLKTFLPKVYDRYTSEVVSDKQPSLKIIKRKGGK